MLSRILRNRWLMLLLIALALSAVGGAIAYARMLRGDIDIVGAEADLPRRGAAPVVTDPSIKYAYDCHLQLNDWREGRERTITYQGKEHRYELFAVAEVTLTQDKRFASSADLSWKWIAAIANESAGESEAGHIEIPLNAPPADAFSTEGHTVSIYAYRRGDKPLEVSLSGMVKLPVGSYFHFGSGSATGDIDSGPLEFYADARLGRSSGPNPRGEPDELARRLFVQCVKR